MSANTHGAHGHDAHDHGEHEVHPVSHYVAVIAVLTAITFVEIGPLFEWYNLPAFFLIILSIVKFVLVVGFFMHLFEDHAFFSQVFYVPLLGAILMVGVLMMLFNSFTPSPEKAPFPIAERYWANYNQDCSSWLRSHQSNRWYCASPKIEYDRIRAEVAPETMKPGGAAKGEELDLAGLTDDEIKAKLSEMGEKLYGGKGGCVACHQPNGAGVPGAFPPLAGSDYAGFLDPIGHAKIILNGLQGEITVNGTAYNGVMQAYASTLSDTEIAAIATYERNAWGNDHGVVTPEQVASAR